MKCNYFQDEKLEYENIEIPDELLFMVRRTVAADRRKKATRIRMRILKMAGSVAAVLFLCLTIGVNSSYAFAETAVKIPIVKSVAKAVVIRSYRPEIIAVYEEYKVTGHGGETPGQPENGEPAEMIPTESGNDVPVSGGAEEAPEQVQITEQEPEEALTGIDAWKAEITPEKLKEVTEIYTPDMEEQYADTPEKLRTILLAKLPGKDIALYGYHENGSLTGAMLRMGDKCQYFDWNYMLEAGKLPELSSENMDGEEKIVVFLYNKEAAEGEMTEENITVPEETEKSADAEEDSQETELEEKDSVSGNDIDQPAENAEKPEPEEPQPEGPQPEDPKPEGPQPGEIWVVSLKGEKWTAKIFTGPLSQLPQSAS